MNIRLYITAYSCVKACKSVIFFFRNTFRFGMNGEEVLENVVCARAHNSEQQMELLTDSAALMCDSR